MICNEVPSSTKSYLFFLFNNILNLFLEVVMKLDFSNNDLINPKIKLRDIIKNV